MCKRASFHFTLLLCRNAAEAFCLAYDILNGLSHMNSLGLVHRNLSPNNVLFDYQVLCLVSVFIHECLWLMCSLLWSC